MNIGSLELEAGDFIPWYSDVKAIHRYSLDSNEAQFVLTSGASVVGLSAFHYFGTQIGLLGGATASDMAALQMLRVGNVVIPIGTVLLASAAATSIVHRSHKKMVGKMPEHSRPSMWRSIGQSLTGGFGVGSSTSKYV